MPYYRRNLYVLCFTIFLASVSWNQVVPFLSLFLKDLGVKDNLLWWTGFVFAIQAFASILAQPVWGKIGDSVGRKPMILRAGIALVLIYFGMSLCTRPWELAVLRFMNGALTGFIPGSITLIATNTPEEYAPRSVAAAQAVGAAGTIAGPALGQWLAEAVGYRGSMQISSIFVLFSTFLVWRLVTEPNKVQPGEKTSLFQDFMISVRSPVVASVMFTMMIGAAFGSCISPFLILHLNKLGCAFSGIVFAVPAVAFVLTARYWTHGGEIFGFPRIIIWGFAGGAVACAVLAYMRGVWSFVSIYFLAGVFMTALSPAAAAIICTKVPEDFRGRAYGMQGAAGTFGALWSPMVASFISTAYGIPAIFVMLAVLFALSIVYLHALFRRWTK